MRIEKKQQENQNRDLQQNIVTLQNEATQLKNTLQTTQQKSQKELIDLQLRFCHLQGKFLGSLFKNKQNSKRISELNDSLSFLRKLLVDKNKLIIRSDKKINESIAKNQKTIDDARRSANLRKEKTRNIIEKVRDKLIPAEAGLGGFLKTEDAIDWRSKNLLLDDLKNLTEAVEELNKLALSLYCNWY